MKYIVLQHGPYDEIPIFFSDVLAHSDMHNLLRRPPIVSAGFCQMMNIDDEGNRQIRAYGESVSLNIKSRPEDSELLTRHWNFRA